MARCSSVPVAGRRRWCDVNPHNAHVGSVDERSGGYARTWQRPPSEGELKDLIDDWVRDEISVREAISARLDREDTVIRRRLRQKFEFLVEDVAEAARPTDRELQMWLTSHSSEFRSSPRVAFRQVFLSPQKRGASVDAEARQLLTKLRAAGTAVRTDQFGDSTMLPSDFNLTPLHEVTRTFGQEFADRIGSMPPGVWTGPIESAYGVHLVLVRERVEGTTPELALVRPTVERELMNERRKRQLKATYDQLLQKYTVVVERSKDSSAPAAVAKVERP